MKITESTIIDKYLKSLTFDHKNSLNLEDDIYYDSKKKMIYSTDTYVEGVHFLNSSNPKTFIKKIFRSSISDIYCKGFKPATYFLSLSINKINLNWLKKFRNELKSESKKYKIYLGGGDTVKSNKLSITISVIGYSNKKPILRNGAKLNNDIYVTGNLSDSYLGLMIKKKKIKITQYKKYFVQAFEKPTLPIQFSSYLNKFATSAIDVSDGLIKDLKSICYSSKCGAKINYFDLPFSNYIKFVSKKHNIKLENIFSKGDDYSILFTADKKYRKLISTISRRTKTKVTRIGKIKAGKSALLVKGDRIINFSTANSGYIHRF
jgi:thiamine-monophosphate kinase